MILRNRQMRPDDVDECVEIIRTHPVVGPRYGEAIRDLAAAWRGLLGSEAMRTKVMEIDEGGRIRLCFVGVSVCVQNAFVGEIKTPPYFWIGPELTRRIARGSSPVLSEPELREANTIRGVSAAVWEGCIRDGYERQMDIYKELVTGFLEEHRGFRWNEIISAHVETVERLNWILRTGGLAWDAERGGYVDTITQSPEAFVNNPHVVGITREMELARPGTWVGMLFDYQPPRCGFSRTEQQLLLAALDGATDDELAGALGVSVPTVKKAWSAIYSRVFAALPSLLADDQVELQAQRGREKKRPLLAYLRDHPEELRPVSRRLLSDGAVRSF